MGAPVKPGGQNSAAKQNRRKIRENFTDLFHLDGYCAPAPLQISTKNPPYHMRNVHVWKTRTEEGEKREVRAERFGGRWRFQAKLKSEERWTYYDVPSLEDLDELRDILWRKYQRKRLPHDDVASIDAMIAEMRPAVLEPPDSSEDEAIAQVRRGARE